MWGLFDAYVYTPHIGRSGLWQTSGHLEYFADSMYRPIDIDGDLYYLKPMSCPFHIEIYKSRPRSYRELPKRYAEYAQVYRYELSGTLQGMTRVRGFCQDDAHTFCTSEQAGPEVHHALKFSLYVLRAFGLSNFGAYLSTRPGGKAIGSLDEWDYATAVLRHALEAEGVKFEVDEGAGAFYGPKIDLKVADVLGREWQLSTIQFDFNLPTRFELEYTGADGAKHRPVMVHRALFGSSERFFAMLAEHYNGAFPTWLMPTQAAILPVARAHTEYAEDVARELEAAEVRTVVSDADERITARIRNASMEKTPYVLVVGNREAQSSTVSVRARDGSDLGAMSIEAFLGLTAVERRAGIARRL